MDEIPVPIPMDDVKDRVTTNLEISDDDVSYTIVIDDESYLYEFNYSDAGMWFERAVLGNIHKFRVNENTIIASISVQLSPGFFMGDIEISYEFIDGQFMQTNFEYVPYD